MVWRILGLSLWWLCLAVLAVAVDTIVGTYPLWFVILVAAVLGTVAIPMMFWRELRGRAWIDDHTAVKANPGNGPRVVRVMLKATTVEALDELHGDFHAAAHRTEPIKVEAAYWWKQAQLQDSDNEDYWEDFIRTFHDESTEYRDAVASEVSRLEEAHEKPKPEAWWSVVVIGSALKGVWTRLFRPSLRYFDVPIRDAIRHASDSTDHSYGDPVLRDEHFFDLLHESMCSGEMLVAGRKDEKGALKRIGREECKNLIPLEMVVPRNPSTLEGVRYCLVERTAYEARNELVEKKFRGYTGLRVRSRDLYRLWPKGSTVGQS